MCDWLGWAGGGWCADERDGRPVGPGGVHHRKDPRYVCTHPPPSLLLRSIDSERLVEWEGRSGVRPGDQFSGRAELRVTGQHAKWMGGIDFIKEEVLHTPISAPLSSLSD